MKEKIKSDTWREALITFLIDHYETNVANKPIVEPAKVLKYTKLYQDISDVYQNFINDKFQFTNNSKDILTYKELYEEFKTWFFNTRNIRTTIKASEFKIEIMNKMAPDMVKTLHIKGILFKPGDNDPHKRHDIDDDEKQAYA